MQTWVCLKKKGVNQKLVGRKTLPQKKVSWVATKSNIHMNDFTVENWIWLNIVCSQVFPFIHITTVLDLRARIVACILDGIFLDVGQFVVSDIKLFKNQGGTHLFFPSLITDRCGRDGVEEYTEIFVCAPTPPSIL